jgi:hypothetical protein
LRYKRIDYHIEAVQVTEPLDACIDEIVSAFGIDKETVTVIADNSGLTTESLNVGLDQYLVRKDGKLFVMTDRVFKNKYVADPIIKYTIGILAHLDDRAIQKLLRETDSQTLAKALKATHTNVQDAIFRNMSKRAASMLKEDMEYMGPIRMSDCSRAQNELIAIVEQLINAGEIVPPDDSDEYVI